MKLLSEDLAVLMQGLKVIYNICEKDTRSHIKHYGAPFKGMKDNIKIIHSMLNLAVLSTEYLCEITESFD